MHEVLVNRLGGLSLPRKSVVRLTDRPDMTLDVYCGRKTTIQQQQKQATKIKGFQSAFEVKDLALMAHAQVNLLTQTDALSNRCSLYLMVCKEDST